MTLSGTAAVGCRREYCPRISALKRTGDLTTSLIIKDNNSKTILRQTTKITEESPKTPEKFVARRCCNIKSLIREVDRFWEIKIIKQYLLVLVHQVETVPKPLLVDSSRADKVSEEKSA